MEKEPILLGGQAVIEGVMIRSPRYYAVACRAPGGEVVVESSPIRSWLQRAPELRKVPLLRGVLAMGEMLSLGLWALEHSASLQLEPSQRRGAGGRWAMGLSLLLGLGIGFLLFVVLPTEGADRLRPILGDHPFLLHLAEGLLRLLVLVGYIGAISLLPEIRRLFAYHGAEHKVVNAFEAGEALEEENIRRFSTVHPRCGTTFLFLVVVVGLLVFALSPWEDLGSRLAWRLGLLPLVVGISYEWLRWVGGRGLYGQGRGWALGGRWGALALLTHLLILPGLLLQKMTTREPTDDMLQVALAALRAVLTLEGVEEGP